MANDITTAIRKEKQQVTAEHQNKTQKNERKHNPNPKITIQ